jgi:orotate phosphoribosyltransferase
VPFFACLKTDVVTYDPKDCPLCRQGMPLVKRGSSKAKS